MSRAKMPAGGQAGPLLPGSGETSTPEQTKRCSRCGRVKLLAEFHIRSGKAGTRVAHCKACRNDARLAVQAAGKCWSHPSQDVAPGYMVCSKCMLKYYKRNAKDRGLCWALTDEQALYLMQQHCAYCGDRGGGIDRRKNEYGYTANNSLPCCSQCNYGKGELSAKKFIEGCHSVSKHCVDRETFMRRNAELQKQLKEFEQWQSENLPVEAAEPSEK